METSQGELLRLLQYQGNVCISGLTAAGKTTISHLLAGEFGLTYVSGSQIQLNFMGMSPIQPKDFWISEEAKALWNREQFERIDAELLRIEESSQGCIFDTSTMPWRHRKPALCIWLESTLESRVIKSIVSHRGRSQVLPSSYRGRVTEKDISTQTLYKELYDIDIGADLSCFDLILDISNVIDEPTLRASLESIAVVYSIVRPAVGWYLTGEMGFRSTLEESVKTHPELIAYNHLFE
jgi:cytidylate kinase